MTQCYTAEELFDSFSVDASGLNEYKFEKVCPAIVQQIESKACVDESEENEEDTTENDARGKDLFEFVSWLICLSRLYVA